MSTPNNYWPAPFAESPVEAELTLPGSKSLTNRALVLGALANAPSTVYGALRSRDTLLMATGLSSLGADVDTTGTDWKVTPGEATSDSVIDCGLAGTVVRFLPPVAALRVASTTFDGDPHLRKRPVGVILRALQTLGVAVTGGEVPFIVTGSGSVPGGQVVIDASASSQFVSGLLLSGARFTSGVDIIHDGKPVPSQPHIDMTVAMLAKHGVAVDVTEPSRWRIGPTAVTSVDHQIEPDLSNAAPFLGLAAITGGTITVRDWPRHTTQAGDALRDILTAMGCAVSFCDAGLSVSGPDQLVGIDWDLHDVGELTPAVAALCAFAEGPSHLRGIAHIRAHETDRLAALATELTGLGVAVVEHHDGLQFFGSHSLHGGLFHTYHDHRMAHAGVLLGAGIADVLVENIQTTSKTFPGFADAWSRLL